MAHQPTVGRVGRGGGGRGGHGGRFPKWNEASAPRKMGEVGACKDLDGNVFTIGSGNKGKDGDLLRTSKEKLALYIGTITETMHARSGCLRSNWCCWSPLTLLTSSHDKKSEQGPSVRGLQK